MKAFSSSYGSSSSSLFSSLYGPLLPLPPHAITIEAAARKEEDCCRWSKLLEQQLLVWNCLIPKYVLERKATLKKLERKPWEEVQRQQQQQRGMIWNPRWRARACCWFCQSTTARHRLLLRLVGKKLNGQKKPGVEEEKAAAAPNSRSRRVL